MNPLTHDTSDVGFSLMSWPRVFSCPILLDEPDRIVDPVSWVEHVPFAFWIVDALRPRTFVELGTRSGNSYAAFAQAVQRLGLTTACYAVDTWKGDPQAGLYGEDVFTEWSAYHDHRFSAFSRLVRATFTDAAAHFQDGSVDLLHIDGYHTLEAVSEDYAIWLPKMSRRGVILLHDTNVRERDFGAWEFWERAARDHPSFAFLHGHGLGVLGIGADLPEPVAWLLSRSPEGQDCGQIRSIFARLGSGVLARHQNGARAGAGANQLASRMRTLKEASEDLQRRAEAHKTEVARERQELDHRSELLAGEIASARGRAAADETEKQALRDRADRIQADLQEASLKLAAADDAVRQRDAEDAEVTERQRLDASRIDALEAELAGLGSSRSPVRQRKEDGSLLTVTWFLPAAIRRWFADLPRRAELRALLRPGLGRRASAGEILRLLKRRSVLTDLRLANTVVQPSRYFALNPDLPVGHVNPLAHFLLSGDRERRRPHVLFDSSYYMSQGPVLPSGTGPLLHFLTIGWRSGLNPHPLFDTDYYLGRYPDVVSQDMNPLVHYLRHGAREHRNAHPLFDAAFYAERNPDVSAESVDPLAHYLSAGGREGRDPNPFFNSAFYLAQAPDVLAGGANPLVHFALHGWREKRRPSPDFDIAGYLADHPDLAVRGTNPLAHFLESVAQARADGASRAAPRSQLRVRSLQPAARSRPVVVCLSHAMPWPPRAGNEYRIFRLLRHLKGCGYTIVPVIAPLGGTEVTSEGLRELADRLGNAVLCDRDGRLEYILNDVPDVLAPMDGDFVPRFATVLGEVAEDDRRRALLDADRTFCHDAAVTTVLHLHRSLGKSVLLAEYIWMSRVLPLLGDDVLKIIDTIDVFSNKREKVVEYGIDDWTFGPDDEARRLRRADLILAIQDEEARQLREVVPEIPVITTGVDFDVVPAAATPNGTQILFVASGNPMNQKGLRDFVRLAWPRIREQVPEAQLLVAGAVGQALPLPPEGVTCLGMVDDVDTLYAASALVINPAVAGTGVKIKTIEALSHLRRVVAWPAGVDGLPQPVAQLCAVAKDWYQFSNEVVRLLQNGAAISPAERSVIERFSSPAEAYEPLTRAIEQFWSRP